MPSVSTKTLKKIKNTRKSKSKTRRNKKALSKSIKQSPKEYYYSHTSSYSKKIVNGDVSEKGVEVLNSSDSNNILVRKMKNGKIIEMKIPK